MMVMGASHVLLTYVAGPAQCKPRYFFGIPSWDTYLWEAGYVSHNTVTKACEFNVQLVGGGGLDFTAVSLIGLGILDIALRLAGLVAVGFIVYGGVQYVLSRGEPDRAKKAQGTIINAVIGLGVAVIAATVVSFIGNRIGS